MELREAVRLALPRTLRAGGSCDAAEVRHACGAVREESIDSLLGMRGGAASAAGVLSQAVGGADATEALGPFHVASAEAQRLLMWSGVVEAVLRRTDLLEVDVAELQEVLRDEMGDGNTMPASLPQVLHLVAEINSGTHGGVESDIVGGLIPTRALARRKAESSLLAAHLGRLPREQQAKLPPTGWGSFLMKVAGAVISPLASPSRPRNQKYAALTAIRARALRTRRAVFSRLEAEGSDVMATGRAAVVSREELSAALHEVSGELGASERDFDLVAGYMLNSGLALEFDMTTVDGPVECFKIAPENYAEALTPASETDRGVMSLRTTLSRIKRQQAALQLDMDKSRSAALVHHRAGRQRAALHELRRKKRLEDVLQKRMDTEEQLRQVSDAILDSQTAAEVLDALRQGGQALKGIHKKHDLSATTVDEVMLDVGEAIADQEEIDQALQQGIDVSVDIDGDEELEAELEELMKTSVPAGAAMASKEVDTVAAQHQQEQVEDQSLVENLSKLSVAEGPLANGLSAPERKAELA